MPLADPPGDRTLAARLAAYVVLAHDPEVPLITALQPLVAWGARWQVS